MVIKLFTAFGVISRLVVAGESVVVEGLFEGDWRDGIAFALHIVVRRATECLLIPMLQGAVERASTADIYACILGQLHGTILLAEVAIFFAPG